MGNNDLSIHVVSETHWDREWYLPFEQFRIRLVNMFDNLLGILSEKDNYVSFMMDGQSILLDDYLEIKPENFDIIKKLVEQGRILIGPWYVLPDEILISGETHIRNYLAGDSTCKKFGKKMNIGYLPDSFGHPSCIPQLLKGLGMDTAVFWRGTPGYVENTEFIWQSPDGSSVLANWLPFGYGNASKLSPQLDLTYERIMKLVEKLGNMSSTGVILLMNGSDHIEPQGNTGDIIEKLAQAGLLDIRHSTLPDFFAELKERVKDLKVYTGEFRSTEKSPLLGGTLGTRMYLKQRNNEIVTMAEKWLEPSSAISSITGREYPGGIIKNCWRYILQNQPHDSICGCSIDRVHREMMSRYDKAEDIITYVVSENLSHIAGIIKTGHNGAPVVVFNTLGSSRSEVVETNVDFDSVLVSKVDFSESVIEEYEDNNDTSLFISDVEIVDDEGNPVMCTLLKCIRADFMKLSPDTLPEISKVSRCTVQFFAGNIPSCGYRLFYARPVYRNQSSNNKPVRDVVHEHTTDGIIKIENEYFEVVPDLNDGTINIYDRESGKIYKGLNRLEDDGDRGDEYTFSFCEGDKPVGIRKDNIKAGIYCNSLLQKVLLIETQFDLPEKLDQRNRNVRCEKTICCPIKTYITLYSGVRRVDVRTVFENHAMDHRLRAVFPSNIKAEKSYAESAFFIDERPVSKPDVYHWEEMPYATHPQKTFVDLNDGKAGLAIANKGLPEYEIIEENGQSSIALTLLRSVGWLSRPDLITRKGNGGWMLETPEAQCPGINTYEYSILPHSGDWNTACIYKTAHEFNCPVMAVRAEAVEYERILPGNLSFIDIQPKQLILSAFKMSEDNLGYIVRFYNTTPEVVKGRVLFGFKAVRVEKVMLNENAVEEIEIVDNSVSVDAGKWEIVTIKIRTG